MKKYICCILLFCMLSAIFAGCSNETEAPVVTYEPSTTAPTTQAPSTSAEPTEETTTEAIEATQPSEPRNPYEMVYSSAKTQRDSVGNIWLNVVAAFENTSDEPLHLSYSTICVFSGDEEVLRVEDVLSHPNVIEPGEYGYYFEQSRVDLDENAELRVEVYPNAERAIGLTKQLIEDIQIHDWAYGIKIYGNYEPQQDSGLVCIAAILKDENGNAFAIITDYFDVSETQFVLSSDRLPEGLRSTDVYAEVYAYPYAG